jgi:hypothetical protein
MGSVERPADTEPGALLCQSRALCWVGANERKRVVTVGVLAVAQPRRATRCGDATRTEEWR